MNQDKKIHQTSAALKQHAWKTPLSIASLALIATLSISAINMDLHAGEPATDAKQTTSTNYTANTFVKITDALIAGKITPEEAAKKIHTTNRINTYLTKVETEISAAVESGKMTVDEGMEKYDAAVKNINKRMSGDKEKSNDRAQAYLTKVGTELRAAVSNGEMTPEEGKAKYAAAEERIKQRMGGDNSKTMTKEDYAQGVAKMNRMVKAGEITREQMEARLNRMKKAMGGEKDASIDRAQAYLTKVGTEIKVAVANGELTSEEGKAKYLAAVEGIQKRMARAPKGEQSERGAKDRRGNRDRDSKGKRGKDRDRRNK